jgi:hypothetical protein
MSRRITALSPSHVKTSECHITKNFFSLIPSSCVLMSCVSAWCSSSRASDRRTSSDGPRPSPNRLPCAYRAEAQVAHKKGTSYTHTQEAHIQGRQHKSISVFSDKKKHTQSDEWVPDHHRSLVTTLGGASSWSVGSVGRAVSREVKSNDSSPRRNASPDSLQDQRKGGQERRTGLGWRKEREGKQKPRGIIWYAQRQRPMWVPASFYLIHTYSCSVPARLVSWARARWRAQRRRRRRPTPLTADDDCGLYEF